MVSGDPESLIERARIAKRERRPEEAAELFRKALAECKTSEDQALRATLYEELAYVERNLRELDSAEEHYRASAEIYRGLDMPLKTAHTLRHAADIQRERGTRNEPERLYAEALEIYRSHPETPPLDLGNAIRGYALLKEDTGDRVQALALWREVKDLYELVGIDAGIAESRRRIGLLSGE
jgi:tetratricopeptide (TPR) repeat protein